MIAMANCSSMKTMALSSIQMFKLPAGFSFGSVDMTWMCRELSIELVCALFTISAICLPLTVMMVFFVV